MSGIPLYRRTFLGASLLATACNQRFFSAEEARTVDAICAQLIPSGPGPGAGEARVVNYIELQLARHFRKRRPAYRQGLANVNAASRKLHGKPFAELSAEQQIEILRDAEENSRDFFDLILAHTRQGFYGDPRHGGNYRMASWKMLGLPLPPIRGRQAG